MELERERQQEAAARRVAERSGEREEHEAVLARPGGLAEADTPERVAKRLDRLTRYYGGGPELEPNGYLLSQAALLDELPGKEEFSYGAYRTYQVPVRRIAELTALGLDPHIAADPLERLEATPLPRELPGPAHLLL